MVIKLDGLIREYRSLETDAERATLNKTILDRYNVTASLLVLDMSGFSKITKEKGIVHFLSMVQQMQEITAVEIERFDGKVVKFFSDNCFAYFPDAKNAVDCGISVMQAHNKLNESLQQPVHICIGIDHGEFLLIEGSECFGHTVNRACKLGEDIAHRGELLVSAQAMAATGHADQYQKKAKTFLESGIEIDAYLVDTDAT